MVDNQIKRIFESKSKIGKETIVRLLTDIVIKDLDDILEFSPDEYYYSGDLVHRFNKTTNKHEIYKCIVDNCHGDNFGDQLFWKEYTMGTGSGEDSSEWSINTVIQDNVVIEEDQDGIIIDVDTEDMFDPRKDSVVVFSSLLGILDKSWYSLKPNGRSLEINKRVYKNETISYFILISASNTTGYNNFSYYSYVMGTNDTSTISYNDANYKPNDDTLFLFTTKHNFIPNTCYRYEPTTKTIVLNNGYLIDKDETVVILRFTKSNGKTFKQIQTLVTDVSTKDKNKILNNPFIYDPLMDIIVVFHSTMGILRNTDYSTEYGKIFINNEDYVVNKGEYLIVLAGEYGSTFYLPDEIIEKSMFKPELRKNIDKLDNLPGYHWSINKIIQDYILIHENSNKLLIDVDIENMINPKEDSVLVFSSIDGILDTSKFSIKPNGRTIEIFKNVYKNETISYLLLYPKNENGGYNRFEYTVIEIDSEKTEVTFENPNFNPDEDELLIFDSVYNFIPANAYRYEKETKIITFNENYVLNEGEKLFITRIYKKRGLTFKNLLTITSDKCTDDYTFEFNIPVNYNPPGDMLVVFHSSMGLMIPGDYFIDSGKIIITNERYFLNRNEYLIFISGEFGRNEKIADESIDLSNMKQYLRDGFIKLLDSESAKESFSQEITLNIDTPSKEILFKTPLHHNLYTVRTEIIGTDGDVGDILITNKMKDKFSIEYTGISSYVEILCTIYYN